MRMMIGVVLVVSLCLAMGCAEAQIWSLYRDGSSGVMYGSPVTSGEAKKLLSEWMSSATYDSRRLFYDMTIPGTHDSGTASYCATGQLWSCTVTTSISEQLEMGIRFFDLRLSSFQGQAIILHGDPPSGWQANTELMLRLTDALRAMTTFLMAHPREVIIVRLDTNNYEDGPIRFDLTAARAALAQFNWWFCGQCDALSTVGDARGKIVLASNINVPLSVPYGTVWPSDSLYTQDQYSIVLPADTVRKWNDVRVGFQRASTSVSRSINYLSAAGIASPWTVASSWGTPYTGPLWTGISLAYWAGLNWLFVDLPRSDCAFCGDGTICSLYYAGINHQAARWLYRGMYFRFDANRMQSYSDDFWIVPRTLGVIPMDFPSVALVSLLITSNLFFRTVGYRGQWPNNLPDWRLACPACIAGDAEVVTTGGMKAAREVTESDVLLDGNGNGCAVVMVVNVSGNGTVYGNYTADHLVADGANATVVGPHGTRNMTPRTVDLVNIATTCPTVAAADGTYFSPISTVFCPQLTMTQYVSLYGALMRIMALTGTFWFDPSIYVRDVSRSTVAANASGDDESMNNVTVALATVMLTENMTGNVSDAVMDGNEPRANVTLRALVDDRFVELPSVCAAMLNCVERSATCGTFEALAAQWMEKRLPQQYMAAVRAAFPSLGDAQSPGSLTSAVWSESKTLTVVGVVVGCCVALTLVVVVVGAVIWRKLRAVAGAGSASGDTKA